MITRRFRRRRARNERGATLVEFAFVFPIFMMLVLGTFSGAQAYDRKLTLTNAAREGSRYGATLAPSTFTTPLQVGIDEWARVVTAAVEQNADGALSPGVDARRICVAYVYPDGDIDPSVPHGEKSHRVVRTTSDTEDFGSSARCFDDGRPDSERRVQIEVRRSSPLQTLFFAYGITLTAQSVTRFEASSF